MSENQDMMSVTVSIPKSRHAEFFRNFAEWLEVSQLPPEASSEVSTEVSTEASGQVGDDTKNPWVYPGDDWQLPAGGVLSQVDNDVRVARKLLDKLSEKALRIFKHMMWHPGSGYTSHELAKVAGLDSSNAVAGALSWPGKHTYKLGKKLPFKWRRDEETGQAIYSMDDEVAQIFRWAEHPEKSLEEFSDMIAKALKEHDDDDGGGGGG